jgi:hypothetical protein
LYVKFSGDAALVATLPGVSEKPAKPCDCVIEHNAWADAYTVSMTIYVGDGVKIEDLSLPAIRGHAAP